MKHILLLFCLIIFSLDIAAQTTMIELPAEQVSLSFVIEKLEKEYSFLCSYKETAIQEIVVIPPSRKLSIPEFLQHILKETELKAEILEGNYLVFSRKTEEELLAEKQQKLTPLCGRIIDSETGAPLSSANVYLKRTSRGIYSTESGNFNFRAVLEKNDTVIISFIGFEEKRLLASDFIKRPCREVSMQISNYFDDLVVIKEYLTDGINSSKSENSIKIDPKKMGSLPGQVEPEILDAIQFLPGITSPTGAVDNICIRGGTPDQNLILWEDIPIYHSAHYFGMISAFNPYIIDEISVFRSGFDAQYGGRIAGVIDLKSTAFSPDKPTFNAGINFLNAYANGKVSFLNNKANFIFSTRRSGAELWRSPTYENITQQIHQGVLINRPTNNGIPSQFEISDKFHFFDTNLKLTFKVTEKDQIAAAYFYGDNDFIDKVIDNQRKRTQFDSLYLKNSGLSLKWKHEWNANFSSEIIGLNSDFDLDYNYEIDKENQDKKDKTGVKRSAIMESQIHFQNKIKFGHNNLKFGYQYVKYGVNYLITRASNETQQANQSNIANAKLQVAYADFSRAFNEQIGIDVGLRFSQFGKRKRKFWEPRFRLWYQPTQNLNFNFSAGKYYQFLSKLVEIDGDKAGIDTPVWVLAGQEDVPILTANQYQAGLIFEEKGWLIDLQIYTKKVKGVTSFATGFTQDFNNGFHVGDSEVRGLDLLIKKRWKNFRSWVSYSQTKNDYTFRSFFDKSFASPNEQRHILNIANTYSFGNFDLSIGWKLKSGLPFSRRENFRVASDPMSMQNQDTIEPVIEELNTERLNFEHQADLSISYTIPRKKNAPSYYFGLSLYNLYNQTNLYNRSFFIEKQGETSTLTYSDKGGIGFTPNLVIRLEW